MKAVRNEIIRILPIPYKKQKPGPRRNTPVWIVIGSNARIISQLNVKTKKIIRYKYSVMKWLTINSNTK